MTPIPPSTAHLVIDLQRLFAEDHGWHVPGIAGIVPNVLALCQADPKAAIYTRFRTPKAPDAAEGQWQSLYAAYPQVTGLDPDILDLIPALRALAVRGRIHDKTTYSAFPLTLPPGTDTVILSGAETDACVFATLLGAVDLGLRVILAVDAVTSADETAHHAVLDLVARRLSHQVRLASTAEILRAWG
jgi:nicotinamidase-related amidase